MIEAKFRVVCEPGAHSCRRKGSWASTASAAETEAENAGWFHEVYRHGHHSESVNRWFCPHHAKKFGKR